MPRAAAPLRAAFDRSAGFVARSLHTTTGMLVARASPSDLSISSKVDHLFHDRPLKAKDYPWTPARLFGFGGHSELKRVPSLQIFPEFPGKRAE